MSGQGMRKKPVGIDAISGSNINSSTGILVQNGSVLALPFKSKSRSQLIPLKASTVMSEYKRQFVRRDVIHACMGRKPLSPYDPNARRSLLKQSSNVLMDRNTSSIKFEGGMHVVDKRRFKTTHNLSYTGLPLDLRGNPGMISDDIKLYRKTLTN